MNVLSLFAGIGGLDLGLERAGMTVVGQVEIDPFCRRVLAKHWPEVPRHDDVRTCVDWWRSEPRPRVDLVCGGFPCQPVSVAGKQLAQGDARWLWPAVAVVVRELRPDWVVLENVPGLLGRGMGDVLGDLAACGYDAEWDCLPAAAVGAPHLRDRVFVVAYPAGSGDEDESTGSHRSALTLRSVAWTSDRVDGGRAASGDSQLGRGAGVVGAAVALAAGDGRGPGGSGRPAGDGQTRSAVASPRLDWSGTDTTRQGRRPWGPEPCGQAAACEQVEDGTESPGGAWWATEPDVGRVAYGVPARVDRSRALGNAVVPQVAEHVGRLVMAGERGAA